MTPTSPEPSKTAPTHCPNCAKPNPRLLAECPFCGVVFSRFETHRQRKKLHRKRPIQRHYAPLGLMDMKYYARFFRRLSRMLDSGVSLLEALRSLQGSQDTAAKLAARLVGQLDKGLGLVAALEQVGPRWPSYLWAHIEAGEQAGYLAEMLLQLALEIEERRKYIMSQIFNWRMLWFFVMLLFGALSLSVSGSVATLPVETVYEGPNAILKGVGLGAIPGFLFYGGLFGALCLGFAWFQIKGKHHLTQRIPSFERFRLNLPFFSDMLISQTLVRYFSLLAKMLSSGLPLPKSLQLARADVDFPQWRQNFEAVENAIAAGSDLSTGFQRVPHLPADLIVELKTGEKTGHLSEGMDHFVDDLRQNVKNKQTAANVGYATALMLLGIGLALLVLLRSLGAWVPLYERVLG